MKRGECAAVERVTDGLYFGERLNILEFLWALGTEVRKPRWPDMRLCYNLDGTFPFIEKRAQVEKTEAYTVFNHWFRLAGYRGVYPLHDGHLPSIGYQWDGVRGDLRRTFCCFLALRLADVWGIEFSHVEAAVVARTIRLQEESFNAEQL